MREFTTCATINVSTEEFMYLRLNLDIDRMNAEIEDQILNVELKGEARDGEGLEVVSRTKELEFKENPVPPLLRGLLKGNDMKFAVDESFHKTRSSQGHAMTMKTRLPAGLGEVVAVESEQWIERVSLKQVRRLEHCMLCTASAARCGGCVPAALPTRCSAESAARHGSVRCTHGTRLLLT